MDRQVIVPSPLLRPHLRVLLGGGIPEGINHLPATPDVQLVVYTGGSAFLQTAAGEQRLPTAFVAGPTMHPRLFRVTPGSSFIAAVFRPAGFLACCGIPANLVAERLVAIDDLLPYGETQGLLESVAAAHDRKSAIGCIETLLFDLLLRQKPGLSTLPALARDHLALPVAALADRASLGARQFERRFLTQFGLPLRDYRRLARFGHVLGDMMLGQVPARGLARLAHDGQYTDQAHFIRDFRQFVGEPPTRFLKARAQEGSIYDFWKLSPAEVALYLS